MEATPTSAPKNRLNKIAAIITICFIICAAASAHGQGANNIVRVYNLIVQSKAGVMANGAFIFYDPAKAKVTSKSGAAQAPVAYYYYYTKDQKRPMDVTKGIATTSIPGYTLPPTEKNANITEKADLAIIKKVLDDNKIDYSGSIVASHYGAAIGPVVVKSWTESKDKLR
jgi:hypothetical protein